MNIDRLGNWLNKNLKEVFEDLNKANTIENINFLETKLGIIFPFHFKELYLKFDGQKNEINTGLFFGLTFLSLKKIEQHHMEWLNILDSMNKEEILELDNLSNSYPQKTIKKNYINKKWIPFAYDWAGNYLGLDFDPDENGAIGQIINFGRDENEKFVISDSFEKFIHWFVEQLEEGNYIITNEEDGGKSFNIKIPEKSHFLDSAKEIFLNV